MSRASFYAKAGSRRGAGFRFQHAHFLLLPTLFHEQVAKLKLPPATPMPALRADGQLEVRFAAMVEWTREVEDWAAVQRLAPFHLWQKAEIEKRFRQDDKALVSLAFIRVQRLSEPFVFPDSPRYGGCRSWVELPTLPPEIALTDVLDEATHRAREAELRAVL